MGPWATAALIAADEVAVHGFLAGTLGFTDIPRVLEAAVARYGTQSGSLPDVDDLVSLDDEIQARYAAGASA